MTESDSIENPFFQYEQVIEAIPGINYIIDRNYNVRMYSKSKWDSFAEANDGEALKDSQQIIGKSVLNFFAGEKVREYYRRIYDLILDGKQSEIRITAKCDAPEVLRDNVVFLSAIYKNQQTKDEIIGILHQSLILSVDMREDKIDFIHRTIDPEGEFDPLEICSLCKSIKYEIEGMTKWISAEVYKDLGGKEEVRLEQSICDECSLMLNEFL